MTVVSGRYREDEFAVCADRFLFVRLALVPSVPCGPCSAQGLQSRPTYLLLVSVA